jgi:hemerythrin-like domain-containing protein
LRALDGICLRIEGGAQIEQEPLSEMLDFTSNFIDLFHHGKEEKHLFPALVAQGILSEQLELVSQEHRIESRLTENLLRAIEIYRNGNKSAALTVVNAARNYSRHLLAHMEREDTIMFPLADELLDDDEKGLLMEQFRQADPEFEFGEKYQQIADRLEARWSL